MKHETLMNDLKMIGIDDKDLRLLNNLYKEQIAAISINGNLSEWAQINRGVRQGCVLSPDLFSLYAENIMRKIVTTENVKVNGLPINNIQYADDTVLLANNTQDLQQLLSSLQNESKKRGLADKKLDIKLRTRLLKCYVWSVLLYGCES